MNRDIQKVGIHFNMKNIDNITMLKHYDALLKEEKNALLQQEYELNCTKSFFGKSKIVQQSLRGKRLNERLNHMAKLLKHRHQSPYLHYFREKSKAVDSKKAVQQLMKLSEQQQFIDVPYARQMAKKTARFGLFEQASAYLEQVVKRVDATFEDAFNLNVYYLLQGNIAQAKKWAQRAHALYDEQQHARFFSADGYKKYVIQKTADYTLEFYKWKGEARGAVAAFDTVELTHKQALFSKYYVNNQQLDIVALRRNRMNYFYENLTQAHYKTMTKAIFSNYTNTYAYGTSLAGYGAVYYGAVIPNVRILAFAPRNSGHPQYGIKRKVMFEHELQLPIVTAPVTLLLDLKNDTDRLYYNEQLKPALVNCTFLPIDYAGHRVPRYLKETGCLRATFEQFFADEPIDLVAVRQHRRESPEYFTILAEELRKHHHYKWAIQASEHALRLSQGFDRPLYQQALAWRALGHLDEAVCCLEEALANNTTLIKITYLLSDLYNELQQPEKALNVLSILAERHQSKSLTNRLHKAEQLRIQLH